MTDLRGLRALVTGASGGIGHAIAVELAARGAAVAAHGGRTDPTETVAALGPDGIGLRGDLTNVADCRQVVEEAIDQLGGLDILVNNAGVTIARDFADIDEDAFAEMFDLNIRGYFFCAQTAVAHMRERAAGGSIVNVTSIAGTRVHPFAGTAYATSKAALGSLTREMAHDFGPHGIRVNAIAPGEIDTAILSPGTDKIVETIPLRRLGATAEVADIIFFLCSQQASYVTGSEIHINGGQHV